MQTQIQNQISAVFEKPTPEITAEEQQIVRDTIAKLDLGELRVCEKIEGKWVTHEWIKKAILIYFRIQTNFMLNTGDLSFFDKIPVKQITDKEEIPYSKLVDYLVALKKENSCHLSNSGHFHHKQKVNTLSC